MSASAEHAQLPSDISLTSPASPLMQPVQPNRTPSPSPTPEVSKPPVSFHADGPKQQPSFGERTLLIHLDNGRNPDIAKSALERPLPSSDEQNDCEDGGDDRREDDDREGARRGKPDVFEGSERREDGKGNSLIHLAAGALQAVQVAVDDPSEKLKRPSTNDISTSTRQLSIHDDGPPLSTRYPSESSHRGRDSNIDANSRLNILSPNAGLPPIISPVSEPSGQTLPSIRSTLGDMKLSLSEHELAVRSSPGSTYPPQSPPGGAHQLPPLPGAHGSPPISPPDSYQRSLPSPRSLPGSSPFYHHPSGPHHRRSFDSSSTTVAEISRSDQVIRAGSTSTSVADRMSIDGITNPGVYVCTVSGCNAPPFQTQYLLNSHANVHSSARPHYCPVPGCSRSEGGKGFKRKNEMIRHGLVHDSPGYVCPFCPDRDHKYPRPDNLQR